MAGHSKWAQIKHKKAAFDAKRGKVFTKIGKNIALAAKHGPDPEMNPSLRTAIAQAKAANMPSDTIEKAILKGSGQLPGVVYEEVLYEGYGPGGVAFIIECVTDNTNRTVSAVRSVLTKHGGSLGSSGSVTYAFVHKGVCRISRDDFAGRTPDAIELVAIDAGADEVDSSLDGVIIHCPREQFHTLTAALDAIGVTASQAGLEWVPITPLPVDNTTKQRIAVLVDVLDDEDDVNAVYTSVADD